MGTLQFELSAPLVLIPVFPQILEEVAPPTQGVELVLGLNRGVWKEEGPDGVASPCNRFPESVCRVVRLCFGNGATASPFWLWKKFPCDLKGVPVPKSGMSCLLVRAGGANDTRRSVVSVSGSSCLSNELIVGSYSSSATSFIQAGTVTM